MPTSRCRCRKNSTVEVAAVSADVSSQGVLGTQRLKSVSGEITADIAGDDSEVRSVSGDLTVRGSGKPISLRANSVSGSLDLTHGAGKLEVVTVSGNARVQMGEASEIRGRTTSGDLEVRAKLTRDGRVDVEGVSGDITLQRVGTRWFVHRDRILQRRHRRLPRGLGGTCQQIRPGHAAQPAHGRKRRRVGTCQDAVRRHRDLRPLSLPKAGSANPRAPAFHAADIVTMSAACVYSNGFP